MRPAPALAASLALLVLHMGSGTAARAETPTSTSPAWATLLPPGVRGLAPEPEAALGTGASLPWVERLPWEPEAPGAETDAYYEVEYTLDLSLERRIRDTLIRSGVDLGHVVVMDPGSGALLAYVSTDPDRFPATGTYPTASLMKVVTAAAVLQEAPTATARTCRYDGSPYELYTSQLEPPAEGGRSVSFAQAMATSNNQCFARLAVRDLGETALIRAIRAIGLLEVPGAMHRAGRLEPLDGPLALGRLGSGLAGSFLSPLSAARLASLLARGELVEPYWIAGVKDAEGRPMQPPERAAPQPVWTAEVATELREVLVNVTEHGTARSAFHDARGEPLLGGVRVSGKTGTLSGTNPTGRYRWFIGVAPAEAPRIAVVSLVVDGSTSATKVAASVFHDLFCGLGPCDGARLDAFETRLTERRDAIASAVAEATRPAPDPEPTAVELAASEPDPATPAHWSELDAVPRPIEPGGFEFPRRLLRKRAHGRVVLLIDLSPEGDVVHAEVEASDLPDFDRYIVDAVEGWRFTPPTRGGERVAARARLPVPIRVN